MRLYIDSQEDQLNIDFQIEDGPRGMKFHGGESKIIQLKLHKDQSKALKALYALAGYESGPIFWAIEEIAGEAFRAGQKMTKFIQE